MRILKASPAVIIHENGNIENIAIETPFLSLKDIYLFLNCETFEIATAYKDEWYMLIDEEGKLKNRPVNPKASMLYREITNIPDIIAGPAIICKQSMLE